MRSVQRAPWLARLLLAPMLALMLALLLALLLPAAHAAGDTTTTRSKQKRIAESARTEAQEKLATLKRDIERNEIVKGHAADALAHSESAISAANRNLRDLVKEQADTEARLQELTQQQRQLQETVLRQQKQLATLLREQHIAGAEDRIKLLLSGDNPNRINREMQYMGYLSQAQAKLLSALRANLAAVEANQSETQNTKAELDEIAAEARAQKSLLESEKARRAQLVTQISGKLAGQRKEVGNIERDEKRLAGLVEKLAKLIEEQQKAEALEREKQRKQAEARKQKEAELRAAQAKAGGDKAPRTAQDKTGKPLPADADDAPAKTLANNELVPQAGNQDGSFVKLKGQLRLPVKGELIARFGGKRGEGPSWKGLFIRTAEGSDIKAVAAGRVVYADWMRGFGNLLIIDHGNQYMTIYGNNQSILKRAGDAVKAGDIVATTGNSGGNDQSGLYFEMRHQGRAFDPLDWVQLK